MCTKEHATFQCHFLGATPAKRKALFLSPVLCLLPDSVWMADALNLLV